MITHLSLFAGIEGFGLAGKWAGWHLVASVENNPFCQKIIHHHFPKAAIHGDITTTDFKQYYGKITVLTGGFPCQPFSVSGKRNGANDSRHLWPQMLRAATECRPTWIIGENVAGITSMVFPPLVTKVESQTGINETNHYRTLEGNGILDRICTDLEKIGYTVQPLIIPACAVGANHRRDRIWIIAHTNQSGCTEPQNFSDRQHGHTVGETQYNTKPIRPHGPATNTTQKRCKGNGANGQQIPKTHVGKRIPNSNDGGELYRPPTNPNSGGQPGKKHGKKIAGRATERGSTSHWANFPTQSPLCTGDDGFPAHMDIRSLFAYKKKSIEAAGNAIVPQVFFEIANIITLITNGTITP